MKCIKCGTDNKLKDRTENRGKCKSCQHPFAFDPKATAATGEDFTDPFFQNVLQTASAQDTLYVTPRQLYYVFNERYERHKDKLRDAGFVLLFIAFVLFGISLMFWTGLLVIVGLLVISGIALLLPSVRKRLRPKKPKALPVSFDQFNTWLQRWGKINGNIQKLLPPPVSEQAPAKVSTELTAYSFDRVVICQHASTAQFLIANQFHFEHNCAVLSLNRYPQSIFDTVMEMLRRNPELKVYALHDASPLGLQMTHRLMTDERWFKTFPNVKVFDLGLLPRQVMNRPVFLRGATTAKEQNVTLPASIQSALQPDEIQWLAEGNVVELESLSPQRLLQLVTLGIAKSRDPQASDALVMVDTGYYDSGGLYVYSSDSFG